MAAMNFTPTSKMGKSLMLKCKTLQEENEEIGNQAKEGKVSGFDSSMVAFSTNLYGDGSIWLVF